MWAVMGNKASTLPKLFAGCLHIGFCINQETRKLPDLGRIEQHPKGM